MAIQLRVVWSVTNPSTKNVMPSSRNALEAFRLDGFIWFLFLYAAACGKITEQPGMILFLRS